MIGLQRHTVQVVESHPQWTELAEQICNSIRKACVKLICDVQHVGSTSVPGLPAKPILDIAAGIPKPDVMPDLIEKMTQEGFNYRGDSRETGGHLFVKESAPGVRIAHIHVVPMGGTRWRNYLRFRDILRGNPTVRMEYAKLKRELRDRFSHDRKIYTNSKGDFIQRVIREKY